MAAIPGSTRHVTTTRTRLARRALPAALLALGLTATACGGDDASSGSGALTILTVQDSASLDPFRASYTGISDASRMAALYDPLVYVSAADKSVKPLLAESLASTDAGVTWTLKLRNGVKFSDGTPFDAAAVKTTWETHTKPESKSIHISYAMGLKLDIVDPLTLKVTPPAPNPNFDRVVASQLAFVASPATIAKGVDTAGNAPVGAGPYKLSSWARGSEQVFVKNDDYWQKDKGLPKVGKVTFKTVPDIKQQLNALKADSADLFLSSDQRTLGDAAKDNLNVTKYDYIGGQFVQFNMRKAPFDDPRARRAIALALDPADFPATLDNGYVPAKGLFPQSSEYFDATAVQPAQNKAEAQKLFDALAAEGKKVDFKYLIPQNPTSVATSELMLTRLSEFKNVSMKIEPLEIGAYIVKFAVQKDFQAMLYSQNLVDPEPIMYGMFNSTSRTNYTGWNNPAADAALNEGRGSTDPAVRKAAYSKLQKALVADLPVFTYSESTVGAIANKKVTGIELFDDGGILMDRIGRS